MNAPLAPRHIAALIVISVLGLALLFSTQQWNVPTAARNALVLDGQTLSPELVREMASDRAKVLSSYGEDWEHLFGDIEEARKERLKTRVKPDVVKLRDERSRYLQAYRGSLLSTPSDVESDILSHVALIRPWEGKIYPGSFHYMGMFYYPLGAMLAAQHALGNMRITPDLNYYLTHPEHAAGLFVYGRYMVALFVLAAAVVFFFMMRRIASPGAAVLYLAGFIAMPMHYTQSHHLHSHVCSLVFLTAVIWMLWRADRSDDPRRPLLLAGIFAGLANSVVLTGGVGLLMGLAYVMFRGRAAFQHSWHPVFRLARRVFLGWLAALIITSPYIVTQGVNMLVDWAWITRGVWHKGADSFNAVQLGETYGFMASLASTWQGMAESYGAINVVLGGAAWLTAAFRFRDLTPFTRVLVVFGLFYPFFAFVNGYGRPSGANEFRYFLGIFPLGVLLFEYLRQEGRRLSRAALTGLALLGLVEAAGRSAPYIINNWQMSMDRGTEMRAGIWIRENLAAGATLGMVEPTDYPPRPGLYPPVAPAKYDILIGKTIEPLVKAAPDVIILQSEQTIPDYDLIQSFLPFRKSIGREKSLREEEWILLHNKPYFLYKRRQ